jgi:hypothetical protein
MGERWRSLELHERGLDREVLRGHATTPSLHEEAVAALSLREEPTKVTSLLRKEAMEVALSPRTTWRPIVWTGTGGGKG